VGLRVQTVEAVHRVWCASSRPIIFFVRNERGSILLRLSSSQRRTTEHVESNECEGFDDSGRKTPWIQKLVRSGVVECWHVRRSESTAQAESSSARPKAVVDRGAARTKGVWRPRLGVCSRAESKLLLADESTCTVRKGMSRCHVRRFMRVRCPPGGAGRSRSRAFCT
jgi:hypothetical protein